MIVIPAIDLIDGRPVRLAEGDYSRKTQYGISALDAAKRFEDGGLTHLHLVDLDGAAGRGNNLAVLDELASKTALKIDFGGGIRSLESMQSALDAGAWKVNVGSAAVKHKDEVLQWNKKYPDRIILSSDARDGEVKVSGWAEGTGLSLIPFLSDYLSDGVGTAVVTDISKDGMLRGPSFELYEKIINTLPPLCLIASGGVSSISDLERLSALGLHGAIVGKAYYEGFVTIEEMRELECLQNA